MDRFTGWTRGTAVAALMVLSTGACAQRVVAPAPVAPPVAQAQVPPVAQVPVVKTAPAAETAPVAKAPVVKAPVAKAAVPKASEPVARVAAPKAAPPPQRTVALAAPEAVAERAASPEPEQAATPRPETTFALPSIEEPDVAAAPVEPPVPAPVPAPQVAEAPEPAKPGLFDFLLGKGPKAPEIAEEAAAPTVAMTEPAELPEPYQFAETASADYGSTVDRNPDAAPEIAALVDADAPPAPPRAPTPPTYQTVSLDAPSSRLPEPEVAEAPVEPVYEPLAAFASLFGGGAEDDAPETMVDTPREAVTPLAANTLPPALAAPAAPEMIAEPEAQPEAVAVAEENPYPGGFDDDQSYDTAQVTQQGQRYAAPMPVAAAYNPNAPVTIAVLTPDSDSRPSIRTLAKGLSQAAALSARTLGNRQLVLRGYDTGGSPGKAQQAAQQAVADGAQLIIGPLFSSSAAAVAPVAQRAGIPVIAFTTDESVLRRGIYSVGYLPDAEVERMLSYAAKRGIRKIGLLSPDTPYGGIVYRTVQNSAPGHGVNVATVQPISPDFAQAAKTGERFAEFYKTNPDVQGVLIATNGKALQGIAAYLAYNDVLPSKVQYMGLGIWDDAETFREATLRNGWFPGLDPTLKTEFENRYRGAYNSKPPAVAALAYDGVAIAGALLQRAQSTGQPPFTVQNIENPTGFRGMSGLFRFLPSGRNQRLLSILKVGRRQFEMVDPAPSTFGQRLTSITGYSQ